MREGVASLDDFWLKNGMVPKIIINELRQAYKEVIVLGK